jgi:putative tricarboxylic transport membrane protein
MDRRIDVAVAAAFMALGLLIIFEASGIKQGMVRDPIGPRAAFYVTGGILAIGGLILVVRRLATWHLTAVNLVENEGTPDEEGHPASAGRAFKLIGAALLYGMTFNPLGYLIATPLFIAVALAVLGQRRPLSIMVIAVLFTAVTYGIFAHALGVRIPVGPLTGPFRELGLINL